jgi:glycosyltransferase involved in cell wall biosynthesis
MPVGVSVVVPTYNRLHYLRQAVGSVRAQTYGDWELIIADDGSNDGTVEYGRAIADERVRVIALPHSGRPAQVRNTALRAATGRHVAFLDSDDLWEPHKLERQLAAMRRGPDTPWSYTALIRIDQGGAPLPESGVQSWRACSGRILPELLRLEALVATPTVIAERSLIEGVGGFDESLDYVHDYDLWFRIGATAQACAVPDRLARVRVHDGARTSDRLPVHRCWVRVYEKAGAAVTDPALERICRQRATRHRLTAAALAADRGRTAEALAGFAAAAIRDPWSAAVWRALASRARI